MTKQGPEYSPAAVPPEGGAGAPAEVLPPERSATEIIRTEITTAMIMRGVAALMDCESRTELGQTVSKSDLVCAVYAAMRQT